MESKRMGIQGIPELDLMDMAVFPHGFVSCFSATKE
jgi:hypothetical protein